LARWLQAAINPAPTPARAIVDMLLPTIASGQK